MSKTTKKIFIFLYIAVVMVTMATVFFVSRTYTVYLENSEQSQNITLTHEAGDTDVIAIQKIVNYRGLSCITLKALKPGTETVCVTVHLTQGEVVSRGEYFECKATRAGLLFAGGYTFKGFTYIYIGLGAIELLTAVWMFIRFTYRCKHDFFTYKSVLDISLGIYFAVRGIMFLCLVGYTVIHPSNYGSLHIYESIGFMMSVIAVLSIPILFVFSLFLTVSNLSLMRHEGMAKNNMLGIFISIMMGVGAAVCVAFLFKYPLMLSTHIEDVLPSVLRNSIAGIFVYFECVFLSSQFCCLYSAKREPHYNKDYIIILGCKIRADGTPLLLLRGRIDRAIRFYRDQLEHTGKQARFIPSGGQGNDEVMSEAESMRRYLIEQGIDDSLILPETKATTTLENMRFSAEIAEKHTDHPRLVFSTTNYHVFRSGILSRKVGLKAAGIGQKTKWYFWPNAQIREFIGLLVSEYKINLIIVALISVSAALFANIGTVIEWMLN